MNNVKNPLFLIKKKFNSRKSQSYKGNTYIFRSLSVLGPNLSGLIAAVIIVTNKGVPNRKKK